MRLLYHRPTVPNFGDDLNAILWSGLAPGLFDATDRDAFAGIGTIVGIDPGEAARLHVFSSGAGYTPIDGWIGRDVEYHCVRGPVTARVLGIGRDRALTDGAILVPLLEGFQPSSFPAHGRVVVVPHFETIAFPGWAEAVRMAGFELVDPRGSPHEVIAALAGARLVITESLHGAILADAFDVPWRPFAVSRNFSTAKWADWTASLDLAIDIVLVPPPDAVQLFRHGRRAEPFGTQLALDAEAAFGEFRRRIAAGAGPSALKVQAKRLLEAVPAARRMLGFSPARTAQAITRVAGLDPFLSASRRRGSLRDEMLERFHALARRQDARLAVAG